MNTRFTVAFLLALIPASGLVAQDTAPVPSADTAPVASADTAPIVKAHDGQRIRPPQVLYPVPIPHEVVYANCDGSNVFPTVNTNDLICFLNRLSVGDGYANCDGSTIKPVITGNDFQCFLNKFAIATQWQLDQLNTDPVW